MCSIFALVSILGAAGHLNVVEGGAVGRTRLLYFHLEGTHGSVGGAILPGAPAAEVGRGVGQHSAVAA